MELDEAVARADETRTRPLLPPLGATIEIYDQMEKGTCVNVDGAPLTVPVVVAQGACQHLCGINRLPNPVFKPQRSSTLIPHPSTLNLRQWTFRMGSFMCAHYTEPFRGGS